MKRLGIKRILALVIYYGFARYLPTSKFKLCKNIRYYLCKNIFKRIGKNVNIEKGAWFGTGLNVEIGDNSGIGINCIIHNNTIIGNNVMMGPMCHFLESIHVTSRTDIPMIDQGRVKERCQVIIEDDVWLGREVLIMNSKIIRKGSIIAARTVLVKNFGEYSIVGGNPSMLIRRRL